MTAGTWQLAYRDPRGQVEMENLDGVEWFDAPVPRRLHRCRPQTRGFINYSTPIYRCACGGISRDGRRWTENNGRRRRR